MTTRRVLVFDIAEKIIREAKAGDRLYFEAHEDEEWVIQIKRSDSTLFAVSNWGVIQSSGLAAAWRSYYDSKTVQVGAVSGEPTRIGSWDNQDIELYPHGTGKVNVRNNGINIPSGKTYDINGTPHSHEQNVLTAKQSEQIVNSSDSTLSDITGLSFSLLSGRRYMFKFLVTFRNAAITTGIGFAFSAPAMTSENWMATIRAGAAGSDSMYQNSSTALTSVIVSNGIVAVNNDQIAVIEGFCEPSENGTLQLRCRSEVDGSQITVQNTGVGYLIDAG